MSLEFLGCKVPEPDTTQSLQSLGVDPAKKTDIETRIQALDVLLKATAQGNKPARQAEEATIRSIMLDNLRSVGEKVRTTVLAPDRARGFERFLVNDMGVVKRVLGLGDEYTEGGWVRESMNRIRRLSAGGLERNLREMGVLERSRSLYKPLVDELKKLKVVADDIDYVMTEAHFQGWYRYINGFATPGRAGQAVLAGRQANFAKEMLTMGIPQDLAKRIIKAGEDIADTYFEVGELAHRSGLSYQQKDFLDQLPRIVSDEVKMRFNWKFEDEKAGYVRFDNGDVASLSDILRKSRLTHEYIVEDDVLLDYVFRTISQQKYGTPTALYDKALGRAGGGLMDVMDSNQALTRSFLDVEPEILEELVDNGLLSKLPLPNREIIKELSRVYDFPFERLREVFAVDWDKGMSVYTNQLQRVAVKSGFVNQLVYNAVEGRWGVPKSVLDSDPKKFQGFVRLSDVLPKKLADETGYTVTRQGELNMPFDSIYVHPTVAALARSTIDLQLSPNALGVYARTLRDITTRFRALALATVGYVQRQLWGTLVSQHAGQGNILLVPHYARMTMMAQLTGKDMSNFLNNTVKKFKLADGRMLTELELWHWAEDTGFMSKFEPLTGATLNPSGYHNWNPLAVRRNMRYMQATLREHNGWRKYAEELGIGASAFLDTATYPIKWANNWLDNAGRFAGLVATSAPRSVADIPRAISTQTIKHFDTVEKSVEHWRNFYYQYDDITAKDKFLSDYVVPFWGFHSKNIPAAIRFVARNPTRFMAYQRVYAMMNRPVATDEDNMLNESTTPGWMMQQQTIYFRMPNGEYFGIPLGSIDPISSGLGWVTQPGEAVAEAFGLWPNARPQATSDRIGKSPWESSNTNAAIRAMLENTYPIYKSLAYTIAGEDEFNRPLFDTTKPTSLLGYETTPVVRMWMESLLPIVGTVNRLNPGGLFGRAPRLNAQEGTWTAGEPSRMPFSGGAARSDRDTIDENNPFAASEFVGLKIYPVDVYLNAGYSYDSLRGSLSEGGRWISGLKDSLNQLDPESAAYARRVQEIQAAEYILEQTRQDMNRLEDWAKERGFSAPLAVQRLREYNKAVGDLAPATPQGN